MTPQFIRSSSPVQFRTEKDLILLRIIGLKKEVFNSYKKNSVTQREVKAEGLSWVSVANETN